MHMLRADAPHLQGFGEIYFSTVNPGAIKGWHAGNYEMVRIPPRVWNGVKELGQTPSIVANRASHPHDPAEIDRLDPFTDRVPYDWALRHG